MAYSTATKTKQGGGRGSSVNIVEAHRVFLTFQWERKADQESLEKVIHKFGEYVQPKENIAVEQFKFNS